MDLKKYKDNLIFVPLGGAKEIGMNLNLYQYKGKWIIIDMGIGFANDNIPGIDVLVPDPSFLDEIKKDVIAIIITHAHEDHLGAVQYLWDRVQKPIYTTKFTAAFLREKLKEYGLNDKIPVNIKEEGDKFSLGAFDLELLQINHSVPEMHAVIISTEEGNVLHTGDWKFDNNPVVGVPDDFEKLRQVGKRKILAMVCDSTNVFNPGHSGSEGDLQESLKEIVKKENNLVVVATFASNIGRVISLIEAAKHSSRKIVLCGRAIERIVKIGVELGYIDDMECFVPREKMKQYPRNKLLIIATGCQGEERAAVRRIADDTYPNIKIQKGDTVIFSSKIIPGNELKIHKILNIFASKQVRVLTEKDHFVHVSGHPGQEELKQMYDLIKPQMVIPVHGEVMHINEHVRFVKQLGIKEVLRVTNGSVATIKKSQSQVIGGVDTGYLGVDGNSLIDIGNIIIKQRRILGENGIIIVKIELDHKGKLLPDIEIKGPGLFSEQDDQNILLYLSEMLFKKFNNSVKNYISHGKKHGYKVNKNGIGNEVRAILKKLIKQSIAKMPLIEVIVIQKEVGK